MKIILPAILLLSLFVSCNDSKESKDTDTTTKNETVPVQPAVDSTLITDTSWGLITSTADINYLKKTFGDANIKDETICGPECVDSIDVTFVYPNTNRAATIYWKDNMYHKEIGMIEADDPKSPYHTASGLRVGSTLRDILKIHPGKISFSGFGWDYGGFIGSFSDTSKISRNLGFRLDLAEHGGQDGLYGDRDLHTEMPLVQKNLDKIIISSLTLSFYK